MNNSYAKSSMRAVGISTASREMPEPILPVDTEIEFQIMVPARGRGIVKGLTTNRIHTNWDVNQAVEDDPSDDNGLDIYSRINDFSVQDHTPGYIVEITEMTMGKIVYPTVAVNRSDVLATRRVPDTTAGHAYTLDMLKR